VRLARLLDTHPYSIPGINLCTDEGDWVFTSEGGSLAFFYQRENPNEFTWNLSGLEFPLNQHEVKRVPIGFPGVQPAELRLDPDANLTDDDADGPIVLPEDAHDLIYVAGGRLGLWVMEAHPASNHVNRAARIDDSQNMNPLQQDSSRYCNAVDFVRLGSVDYLVALFSYDTDSRLRFYPLSAARQVLPNAIALGQNGFGAELTAVREVTLTSHPGAPPIPYHPNNLWGLARPFGLDLEVDAITTGSPHAADLYVAMGPHGVVRVAASAVGAGSINVQVDWGPMFGTNCPGQYDVAVNGALNASGYPATRYQNIDWISMQRDERFDELTRSDAPQFIDLAVQRDSNGRFLYAAVDHLAWVRFDLNDPWGPGIPIDHHEGEDVSIQDSVRFPQSNDAWGTAGGVVVKETTWDPPLVRAIDRTGSSERVLTPFCREIEVASVERSVGVFETIVVALYAYRPWNFTCRGGRGPGLSYDSTLSRSGNVDGGAVIGALQGEQAMTFHWVSDLTPGVWPTSTYDGYINGGGFDIYVPPIHTVADRGRLGAIKLIHGSVIAGQDASLDVEGSCVSFFFMDDLTPGAPPGAGIQKNAPVFVRDFDEVGGRYAFGMGYAIVDPTIMLTSFQEAGIGNDGILYTPNLAATGAPPIWKLEPLDGVADERGIVGLNFEQECQWEAPSVSSPPLSANWTWGQLAVPGSTNHWRIAELPYTPPVGSGLPTVALGSTWTVNTPYDRWEHVLLADRPEHLGGMVSAGYDTYTIPLEPPPNDPLHGARTFAFASRGGSNDGMQLVARNQVESGAQLNPSGGLVSFLDPRNPPPLPLSPWHTCQFDTHPEWGKFAAQKYDPSSTGNPFPVEISWTEAKNWWRTNSIAPLQIWAGESRTWPPEMVRLADVPGNVPRNRRILVVPCGNACCPPNVTNYSAPVASGGLGLPALSMGDPTQLWASQYRRGFLQLFDVTDPWQLIRDSKVAVTNQSGAQANNFVSRVSSMDPLFLPDAGSHAYRISTIVLSASGVEHVLVFVTDFDGRVHCFDITNAIYTSNPAGFRAPVATWDSRTSPLAKSPFDGVANNIRAIATDRIDTDEVMVYIGVSRVGILSIPYRVNIGFDTNAEHRIKTPGEVWGLEVRPATTPTDRILLVTDSYCGMRIYGLVDLDPAKKDDTSEEDA